MSGSVPVLAYLLPLLAVILLILLAVTTVMAVRRLTAGGATPEPPESSPNESPTIRDQIRRGVHAVAALYTGGREPDAVPMLIAVGGDSDSLRLLLHQFGGADLTRVQRDLLRGDCRVAIGPDGGLVTFADGLIDSERWEERWDNLLYALSREREERPFDGIVVVVPAQDLVGPSRLSDDDLALRGQRLYQILAKAQRVSGWRVPIYLIISDGERLNGFAVTVEELPERMRSEPFGWTVPYAVDTVFERGWVVEGIEGLIARLSSLQMSLLARLTNPAHAESILLFPNALEQMKEPLAALLFPMLQPSAYHDAFMFRGFYLIGRSSEGSAGAAPDLFAAHLLHTRIFPEQYLARPARGALTNRQQQVRVAQVVLVGLAVLAIVGLAAVRSHNRIYAEQSVLPLLKQIQLNAQLAQAQGAQPASDNASPTQTAAISSRGTRALIKRMAEVSLNRLETPWAPLSYFTNVSAVVEEAIREAYGVWVLRFISRRLIDNIPELLGVSPSLVGKNAITKAMAMESECAIGDAAPADVAKLTQVTSRLGDYGQQLVLYQDLTTDAQIGDLKQLLEFTLGVSLPPAFTENYALYQNALQAARPPLLDTASIRSTVSTVLRAQFLRALTGAYPGSSVGLAINGIVANAGIEPSMTSGIDRLRSLDTALHTAEQAAPKPQDSWLRTGAGNVSINAALDRIAALLINNGPIDLAPVDPSLPAELRQEAAACQSLTRQRLLAATVYGGVPVLSVSPTSVQLSPTLIAVDQALDSFFAQPVAMVSIPATGVWQGQSSAPLFWNPQDLQTLQTDTESYLAFVAQSLPLTLPTGFRTQVQAAAGMQLDTMVQDAIARAQQAGLAAGAIGQSLSTASLSDEMARFGSAVPTLSNVQILLRGANRLASAERLNRLLAGQAVRLLRRLNAILSASDPYQLPDKNLMFWNGSPPLAASAFGAATLSDLVGTLPARRDFVQSLARDQAAPIVAYLQQSNVLLDAADRGVLAQWQGILSTLNRYQQGNQANSLSRLEQFITTDMNRVDLANCDQITAGTQVGSDWFAAQLGNIGRLVRTRCNQLSHGESVASYDDLAATFNRDLAGRFPFGAVTGPDAEPADVKGFYSQFGAGLAGLKQRLAGISSYADAGASAFIDQLIAVQTALAPMLADPALNTPLTYNVTFDFRTNVGSDPGANQILESIAQFGPQKLSSYGPSQAIAWSNGQDVTISFVWAKDAPNVPTSVGSASQPRVNGLTASYTWGGPWALLRMIAARRPNAAVIAQLSDRKPEIVDFTIPLALNDNPIVRTSVNMPARLTLARVFMRLGLTGVVRTPAQPDKHQPVILPFFPTAAPEVADVSQGESAENLGAGQPQ